uniref:Putative ATP synthase CF1 subunit delta n=1 Tax=Vischeria sp. ACOI 3415 TaxID=2506143 RepID=A0A410D336_9STRA|nr:putative ATP synthase CF1 subunit delta [Vischeria sp. ACOI 3415]QAA12141.1 putative ATP synthase CF1 subunit delta [Vischeria sp. ACOI 3415]
MGCVDKIQLSQKLIQNFIRALLVVPNSYDMYYVAVWFKTLSYYTGQTFPTRRLLPNQAKSGLTNDFLRYFKNHIRYKLSARRKDSEDFITSTLLTPTWKYSFHNESADMPIGKWFYEIFRTRMVSSLPALIPSIFDKICRMHRIRIIDEICTVEDWTSRFNRAKLMDKLSDVLDFSDENPEKLNPSDYTLLIKKQLTSKNIIRGYTCRLDSVVFNFTTNRLLGSQLIEHFYD